MSSTLRRIIGYLLIALGAFIITYKTDFHSQHNINAWSISGIVAVAVGFIILVRD